MDYQDRIATGINTISKISRSSQIVHVPDRLTWLPCLQSLLMRGAVASMAEVSYHFLAPQQAMLGSALACSKPPSCTILSHEMLKLMRTRNKIYRALADAYRNHAALGVATLTLLDHAMHSLGAPNGDVRPQMWLLTPHMPTMR